MQGFVLRKDWKVLQKDLPLKEEYVLLVQQSLLQKKLYNRCKKVRSPIFSPPRITLFYI
jgi:hypothetical protein